MTGIDDSKESRHRNVLSPMFVDVWLGMAYRVFESLVESGEAQLTVSVPQLISNMTFLLAVCDFDSTKGLRSDFSAVKGLPLTRLQSQELVDATCEFVKKWKFQLVSRVKPGHILNVQRVVVHPKFATTYSFSTFKNLSQFGVEVKIFGGFREVNSWLDHYLQTESQENSVFQLWPDNSIARNRQLAKKKQFVQTLKQQVELVPEENRDEQKCPILAWASHSIISIPPDVLDMKAIYFVHNLECMRIKANRKKIEIIAKDNEWNTLILPTSNHGLQLHFIYGMSSYREVTFEKIKQTAAEKPYAESPRLVCNSAKMEIPNEEVFIPVWSPDNTTSLNLASNLNTCFDMSSIFYVGGLGDLAREDATPSCASPPSLSHIQSFDALSICNAPHSPIVMRQEKDIKNNSSNKSNSRKRSVDRVTVDGENHEVVSLPYIIMLWDSVAKAPVYFSRISSKADIAATETKEKTSKEKIRSKCVIM